MGLLRKWGTNKRGTVGILWDHLHELERFDIVEDEGLVRKLGKTNNPVIYMYMYFFFNGKSAMCYRLVVLPDEKSCFCFQSQIIKAG